MKQKSVKEGDRLRMTVEGEDTFPLQKVRAGIAVQVSNCTINVLIDGEETPSRFHRDYWEKMP